MFLVLTGSVLFAGFALGSMFAITKEPVDAAKATQLQNSIREVLPSFAHLNEPEVVDGTGTFIVHRAFDNNHNFVGAAVESYSNKGFNGMIRVMVGFDNEGNIVNYAVLEQKETPGLGTKMVDWFKPVAKPEKSILEKIFGYEVKPVERKSSIIGKNPLHNKLSVVKDGGEIDAITSATISSRAFLETVQSAYEIYKKSNSYE
jgi:electron transport complex protein RnfG